MADAQTLNGPDIARIIWGDPWRPGRRWISGLFDAASDAMANISGEQTLRNDAATVIAELRGAGLPEATIHALRLATENAFHEALGEAARRHGLTSDQIIEFPERFNRYELALSVPVHIRAEAGHLARELATSAFAAIDLAPGANVAQHVPDTSTSQLSSRPGTGQSSPRGGAGF